MGTRKLTRHTLVAAFVVAAAILGAPRAAAQTFWVASGTGNWFVPGNWSGGVPGMSSDAQINNGGTAQVFDTAKSNSLALGINAGNKGTLDVDGGVISVNTLAVGTAGEGTLKVHNAAQLIGNQIFIGINDTASGTAAVDGPLSHMGATGDLAVGYLGHGALTVSSGGVAENNNGNVGFVVGGTGDVIVTGAGSWWKSHSVIAVGVSGGGTLTVADGGLVTSVNGRIAREPNSTGTVIIDGPGSQWNCTGVMTIASSGVTPSLGKLTLRNGGAVSAPGGLTIYAGGSLEGTGVVTANVTNRARVSPGTSPGELKIMGTYFQQGIVGLLYIDLASSSSFDRLTVSGNATFGGGLNVSLLDGYVPVPGTTFDILKWGSRTGTFDAVNLPPLPSPLAWNQSQLYVNGKISVTSPYLAADFDENFAVNGADLTKWRTGVVAAGTTHLQGNADFDQDVDGADFLIWQRQLGGVPIVAATAAVPEPGAVALISIVAAGWSWSVRRRFERGGGGRWRL